MGFLLVLNLIGCYRELNLSGFVGEIMSLTGALISCHYQVMSINIPLVSGRLPTAFSPVFIFRTDKFWSSCFLNLIILLGISYFWKLIHFGGKNHEKKKRENFKKLVRLTLGIQMDLCVKRRSYDIDSLIGAAGSGKYFCPFTYCVF